MEYRFFSAAQLTFFNADHILGHIASLKEHKEKFKELFVSYLVIVG